MFESYQNIYEASGDLRIETRDLHRGEWGCSLNNGQKLGSQTADKKKPQKTSTDHLSTKNVPVHFSFSPYAIYFKKSLQQAIPKIHDIL